MSSKDLRKGDNSSILFFTCCNQPYFHFAAIYPLFVLENVPNSKVEIGVTDLSLFSNVYAETLAFYEQRYAGRVLFRECKEVENHTANSIRFLYQPETIADYVYIGDIDIMILANDIVASHLTYMHMFDLDYSNILRPNTLKNRLTGLHFCPYESMYPLPVMENVKAKINDEEYLYLLMQSKGFKVPPKEADYRPMHGIHCSLNRPIFDKTPVSKIGNGAIKWGVDAWTDKFLAFTKRPVFHEYMKTLSAEKNLTLIKLVEDIELACFYHNKTHPFRFFSRIKRVFKRYRRFQRNHLSI